MGSDVYPKVYWEKLFLAQSPSVAAVTSLEYATHPNIRVLLDDQTKWNGEADLTERGRESTVNPDIEELWPCWLAAELPFFR